MEPEIQNKKIEKYKQQLGYKNFLKDDDLGIQLLPEQYKKTKNFKKLIQIFQSHFQMDG